MLILKSKRGLAAFSRALHLHVSLCSPSLATPRGGFEVKRPSRHVTARHAAAVTSPLRAGRSVT